MRHQSPEMQSRVEGCLRCCRTCSGMLMNHRPQAGGEHLEAGHVRVITACAETRRTSAAMTPIGIGHHKHTCREYAENRRKMAT